MKNLECSSRGDKRFSAFYAKVRFNGKLDSIENHYQKCKRLNDGSIAGKGKRPDYILLKDKKVSPSHLTAFYKLLWIGYFKRNPDLLTYAKQFDTFSDMFRGKSINCQADVIRDLSLYGIESMEADSDILTLISLMSS